jgi:hypothetical protein
MTAHASRTIAVLGCAAFVLAVVQACSGEPRTAIAPPAKIDAGAPPGEQGCICPPQACPSCPVPRSPCPEPAVSANRTPEPCKTDMDCYTRSCDKGFCGPLRTGNLPNRSACKADDQCESGLCDRDICMDIGGLRNGNFGRACEPLKPFAQRTSRPEDECGGYICLDGRCRSCVSDAECTYWKGGGKCEHNIGRPGNSCFRLWPLSPDSPFRRPPVLPPDPPLEEVCAVCPPEPPCPPCPAPTSTCPDPASNPHRTPGFCTSDKDCSPGFCNKGTCGPVRRGPLSNGEECKTDDYCESLLCDRGVCTDIGGPQNGNHGEPCKPLPPFARRAGRSDDSCGGYMCLDGNCRSCVSDAECTYWKGGGTCDYHPGLPGLSCSGYPPPDAGGPSKPPPAVPP